MKLRASALGALLVIGAIVAGCGGEDGAERAAAEFSSLAAAEDEAACDLVEPERLDQVGGCSEFLDSLAGGPGATSCLQQLDVTRSASSPDGSTVVAFDCGPTSPTDGEAGSFGEYELVDEDGRWLIRDGYIEPR